MFELFKASGDYCSTRPIDAKAISIEWQQIVKYIGDIEVYNKRIISFLPKLQCWV